jgi:glycine C-acetyltransferase
MHDGRCAAGGGENFDLRTILLAGRAISLKERTELFGEFLGGLDQRGENSCLRPVASAADREVMVADRTTGALRPMLMFGSNNYLGMANHPDVCDAVCRAIRKYGIGVGGPPLLNGYTLPHRELEERLAAMKGAESALLFSSGYAANVGVMTGLTGSGDRVICDEYSHASFCDGVKMAGVRSFRFPHNDLRSCEQLIREKKSGPGCDTWLGVEGLYSMDGDRAPLEELVPLCRATGTLLVLDDAHGSGVLGAHGRGAAEEAGVEGMVDVTVGTFSKTFAATGGFATASKPVIDYLRYFARSYMFSASLPPSSVATVLACLDVMEKEPWLLASLRANIVYAREKLGITEGIESPIIPLRVPAGMNIRGMARRFDDLGIFLNSVEYPAVPLTSQRFRVSLMATHTCADIDRLVDAINIVWSEFGPAAYSSSGAAGRKEIGVSDEKA